MRNQILQQITTALELRNTYFLREIDIQIYLANYFKNVIINNNSLYDNVFVEYHIPNNLIPNCPWSEEIYIDIVLEKDGYYYPIEIKFYTKKQSIPLQLFGENINNVTLEDQKAYPKNHYAFWNDIKRIELLEQTFNNVERGIMLLITNDEKYFNIQANPNINYVSAEFEIYNGRLVQAGSQLNWNGNPKLALGRPQFTVNYDYTINWMPLNLHNHNYILI